MDDYKFAKRLDMKFDLCAVDLKTKGQLSRRNCTICKHVIEKREVARDVEETI